MEGWRVGLKALAIYRDGSKKSQPLATSKEGDRAVRADGADGADGALGPARRRLPATRQSLTHKFSVGGHEGYITVGLFEDGTPGELFITMAKEGSTIGGLMDTIGTLTSMSLQYGVPLEALTSKFSHMRFEPSGWTGNQEIPNAKSVVDYIFRWLGIHFQPGYGEPNAAVPIATESAVAATEVISSIADIEQSVAEIVATHAPGDTSAVRSQQFAQFQVDAPACDSCGAITVRNGNCYLCHNCGNSMGCS
jgi:ribonucleoside-diphosphate reductase alpha chain